MRILAACLLALTCSSFAVAAPHTPVELLRPGAVRDIAMSPDGRHIAIGVAATNGRTDFISVIDFERPNESAGKLKITLNSGEAVTRLVSLRWFNNSRLLVELAGEFMERQQLHFSVFGGYVVDTLHRSTFHSVDAVGDGASISFESRFDIDSVKYDPSPAGDSVAFQAYDKGRSNLYRFKFNTGAVELLENGDNITCCWRVRGGRAVLKVNIVPVRRKLNVFVRAEGMDSPWVLRKTFDPGESRLFDSRFAEESRSTTEIYLRAAHGELGTDSIQQLDLATGEIVAMVAEAQGFDIDSALVIDGQFVAARYVDDKVRQVFADPILGEHVAILQERLAPSTSVEVVGADNSLKRLLLHVSGPQSPGEYDVYDTQSRELRLLVKERPWLDPMRLAPMTVRRTTTRDGAIIRSYLTCPKPNAEAPVPLVVMPPAGPWTRASIRFNPVAQAFASQGWCVLEPNYRGVHGYGRKFQKAGFGRWSGRVAQDIVDAISDVVAAGIADPGRIAVYAEMLGADAALAGAIENPDLYRAIVTRSAVVDLDLMDVELQKTMSTHSEIVRQWRAYRGHESREASPLAQAGKIRPPVLLIHADRGEEVSIEQSMVLQAALEKADRPPTTLWQSYDWTWDSKTGNEVMAVQQAIAFLQSHL